MVNDITISQTSIVVAGGVKTFYFNSHDGVEQWETTPGNMVDGDTATLANTAIDLKVQLCDTNTCTETSSAVITKVEVRVFSLCANFTETVTAYIRPVFVGGDGDNHGWIPPSDTAGEPPAWSDWIDITIDTNAPISWGWTDIVALDVDIYPDLPVGGDPYSMFAGKIEVRVTYSPITLVTDCKLTAPDEVSDSHSQNVKMLNLWSGERILFGLSRSKWGLVLTGREWVYNTSTVTGYFDDYDAGGEEWGAQPANMVDGDSTIFAATNIINDVELLTHNTITEPLDATTCNKIKKVEIRLCGYTTISATVHLRPVFTSGDGNNHVVIINSPSSVYSEWYDITTDTNAPSTWTWNDIQNLDCDVELITLVGVAVLVSIVEIRVTYVDPDPCCRIQCVRNLGLEKYPVIISGLHNINWDGTWRILSFGWQIICECPEHIEWILELERYD